MRFKLTSGLIILAQQRWYKDGEVHTCIKDEQVKIRGENLASVHNRPVKNTISFLDQIFSRYNGERMLKEWGTSSYSSNHQWLWEICFRIRLLVWYFAAFSIAFSLLTYFEWFDSCTLYFQVVENHQVQNLISNLQYC